MNLKDTISLSLLGVHTVVFSGLLLVVVSCSTLERKIKPPAPELNSLKLVKSDKYRQSATLPDTLALDSLVKYVEKYPYLVNLMEGPNNYTLFAPSNKAFKNLMDAAFNGLSLDQVNSTLLEGVLRYHFASGVKSSKNMRGGTELPTLFKDPRAQNSLQQIIVNSDGTLKTGAPNQAIKIRSADNLSTNGIVHLVDEVLFPPSIAARLASLLGTVALSTALLNEFSILDELIYIADKDFEEDESKAEFKIISWLSFPKNRIRPMYEGVSSLLQGNPELGITFFAIPNQTVRLVLGDRKAFLSSFDVQSARQFLLNHLVWGRYELEKMTDGLVLNTVLAGPSSITTAPTLLTVARGTPNPTSDPLGLSLRTQKQRSAPVLGKAVDAPNGVAHNIFRKLPPD